MQRDYVPRRERPRLDFEDVENCEVKRVGVKRVVPASAAEDYMLEVTSAFTSAPLALRPKFEFDVNKLRVGAIDDAELRGGAVEGATGRVEPRKLDTRDGADCGVCNAGPSARSSTGGATVCSGLDETELSQSRLLPVRYCSCEGESCVFIRCETQDVSPRDI